MLLLAWRPCSLKYETGCSSDKQQTNSQKAWATTFSQFPTSLSFTPASPLCWHPIAMLLKGLPLPLGWLLDLVADSVCSNCVEFPLWSRTAGLEFLGCSVKVFWNHRNQCHQLHLWLGVNGQYLGSIILALCIDVYFNCVPKWWEVRRHKWQIFFHTKWGSLWQAMGRTKA